MTTFACAASTVTPLLVTGAAIAITCVNVYVILRSNATIRELRDAGVLPPLRGRSFVIRQTFKVPASAVKVIDNERECEQ